VGWEQIMILPKEHLVRVEEENNHLSSAATIKVQKVLDIARHGSPFFTMVASHNHQHDWLDI
jgi:hypothetical protein